MLVGFNSYMPNNRNQKTSFGAVNQKYFQAAQDAVQKGRSYQYPIQDLKDAYGTRALSKENALDTLAEIKTLYPQNFKKIAEQAITWVNEFKWTS